MTILAFEKVPHFPTDANFELTRQYLADTNHSRLNLGQGVYRDGEGKPWILPCVRSARKILENQDHEYLPILGLATFRNLASELLLGQDSLVLKEGRVSSCQALSGTGALHLAGLFLKRYIAPTSPIYVSDPTWINHHQAFDIIGFEVRSYNHYIPESKKFDFDSMMQALRTAPEGAIFVLHASAHNPTGCDPLYSQWRSIAQIMKERNLFPLFDAAYLGMVSGSFAEDAAPIRLFVNEMNMNVAICLSFAKIMGLYGERVGLVAFVCPSEVSAINTTSTLQQLQRSEISCPPAYGAYIAATVLGDAELKNQWDKDLVTMSSRITGIRGKLFEELKHLKTPGDWSHVVNQKGMFCILGLSKPQIKHLKDQHHVYMAGSSRISIAGLNEGNVKYFAHSLDQTVRSIV